MIFAQIKNGVVHNVITLNSYSLLPKFAEGFDDLIEILPSHNIPSPGWIYEDDQFSPNPVVVFAKLSPRQVRLGLVMSGITLESIEAALELLPEPDRSIAKISWEYAVEYERENPIVDALAALIGLSSVQVDELWAFASTL